MELSDLLSRIEILDRTKRGWELSNPMTVEIYFYCDCLGKLDNYLVQTLIIVTMPSHVML